MNYKQLKLRNKRFLKNFERSDVHNLIFRNKTATTDNTVAKIKLKSTRGA